MLRRIYFLGVLLLLCITDISFCYDYLSNEDLNSEQVNRKFRVGGRKSRRKFDRRNQAHIDVASFIQRPDESLDENETYEQFKQNIKGQSIDYGNFGAANINEEVNKDTREYQNLYADKIPEVNILNAKHFVPQHMNLNGLSMDAIHSPNIELHKLGTIKQFDSPYERHFSRKEKKCAGLKKMKFPFFSHNNAKEKVQDKTPARTKNKDKKDKKRRLFSLRSKGSRKVKIQSTSVTQKTMGITNSIMVKSTDANIEADKIFKRSYFEKLCPACKKIFFGNSKSDERRKTSNGIIHNSRQYFQRKTHNPLAQENDKPTNFEMKPNSLENVDFDSSIQDRRRKRDLETIEEKQKKVLEETEKV
ncbi:uncharacterized protein LOC123873129 [Maniola jurtina]|uniref:uncharacterized protein LOC123873129 n=1 Tax=Maniola jurtina TaxID=191418 RepID=UPI001E68D457|nr:uncharacterized protein LOC123873129 [Maniola jurtina]